MRIIDALLAWWRGEPVCKHTVTIARFRWIEEWAEFYDECVACGKEFTVDD